MLHSTLVPLFVLLWEGDDVHVLKKSRSSMYPVQHLDFTFAPLHFLKFFGCKSSLAVTPRIVWRCSCRAVEHTLSFVQRPQEEADARPCVPSRTKPR
jgi:hypothetical protein